MARSRAGTTGLGFQRVMKCSLVEGFTGAMKCPLAVSNRRTVGLNGIGNGCPDGRENSPFGLDEIIMGVLGGSRNAPPNGDETAIRFNGAKVINESATGVRDATGERFSVSLAKIGMYYIHILQLV